MSNTSPSAPLDETRIQGLLSQYWRVSVVDVTGSTQDDLVSRANAGDARNGAVLIANYQSEGRGRLDRKFEAQPSTALLFSMYIQPERSPWSWLTLLVGQSISAALSPYEMKIELKWPNDLMIGDKKVGGIIATRAGSGVVIGVGINVQARADELPIENATSLSIEEFKILDRNHILAEILSKFESNLAKWHRKYDEELRLDYKSRSSTIGKKVTVSMPGGAEMHGLAVDVAATGELVLEDGSAISVGDVIHLR